MTCDNCANLRADAAKLNDEWAKKYERLRLLVRCETIEPPYDVADDCTTELTVEVVELRAALEEEQKLKAAHNRSLMEEVERLRVELAAARADVERLNKMRAHCPDCGGYYMATGLSVCPCKLRAELATYERALGLLSTLAPKVEINAADPVAMAEQIERAVRAELAAAERRAEGMREALDGIRFAADQLMGACKQFPVSTGVLRAAELVHGRVAALSAPAASAPSEPDIANVVRMIAEIADVELMALTESQLSERWYYSWRKDRSISWNIYEFSDRLEMFKRACQTWERRNGTCCIVERVRDKYLMPKIKSFIEDLSRAFAPSSAAAPAPAAKPAPCGECHCSPEAIGAAMRAASPADRDVHLANGQCLICGKPCPKCGGKTSAEGRE